MKAIVSRAAHTCAVLSAAGVVASLGRRRCPRLRHARRMTLRTVDHGPQALLVARYAQTGYAIALSYSLNNDECPEYAGQACGSVVIDPIGSPCSFPAIPSRASTAAQSPYWWSSKKCRARRVRRCSWLRLRQQRLRHRPNPLTRRHRQDEHARPAAACGTGG